MEYLQLDLHMDIFFLGVAIHHSPADFPWPGHSLMAPACPGRCRWAGGTQRLGFLDPNRDRLGTEAWNIWEHMIYI